MGTARTKFIQLGMTCTALSHTRVAARALCCCADGTPRRRRPPMAPPRSRCPSTTCHCLELELELPSLSSVHALNALMRVVSKMRSSEAIQTTGDVETYAKGSGVHNVDQAGEIGAKSEPRHQCRNRFLANGTFQWGNMNQSGMPPAMCLLGR